MFLDKPKLLASDATKQMQQQPASVTNSLFGNEVVDALVLFQSLLYVDEKIDAVNHGLNKLHLRITETV